MRTTAFPDLFELEPSTALYVPRPATVEALAQLQNAIEHDEPVALLRGPAGIGKTLLLRLLRRRVEGRMGCIALEATGQAAEALCAQALRALGQEPGGAPIEELAAAAGERGRGGVLLLVDRAENLPAEVLPPLLDLATRCPALQLVLAAETPAGAHAWLGAPDPRMSLVELCQPMSARETIEYLLARLDLGVAPAEARRRLGWRRWPRLIRESQGNPARLHHLARRLLDGDSAVELPPRLAVHPTASRRPLPWGWLAIGGSALALLVALALLMRPAGSPEPAAPPAASALRPPEPAVDVPPKEPLPAAPARAEPAPPPTPAPRPQPPAVAQPEPAPRSEPAPHVESPPAAAALPSVEAGPVRAASAPAPVHAEPAPRPRAPVAAKPSRVPPATAPKPEPLAAAPQPAAIAARVPPADAAASAQPAAPISGEALESLPTPAPAQVATSVPVFVNAVPAARIAIDGRDVGSTPIVGLLIPEGSRRFVASFADGRRLERSVEVEGAEVYVLFP